MFEKDGICYAGEYGNYIEMPLVAEVKVMNDYKLYLRFKNNKEGIYDFKPLLQEPCYRPLQDKELFKNVCLEYGMLTWNNGEIDIAPETLFEDSTPI